MLDKLKPVHTEPTIRVELSNLQAHLIVSQEWVDRIVGQFCRDEVVGYARLSLSLVDNASIRGINARYLGHDWETDVISFPDADETGDVLAGELILSTELAAESAKLNGCEPLDEVALYLVHGLLHLRGYDDQTPDDVLIMRRREAEILHLLGIANPFGRFDPGSVESDDSERESVPWPR